MKQTGVQQKKCERCTRLMVAITLDIDSEKRTLRSCSHCDIREWEAADTSTSLQGVLKKLSDSASR